MSNELLPCPFCGTDNPMVFGPTCNKRSAYDPADRAFPTVRCRKCYAEAHGKDWDEACTTAVAAWNTRTPAPVMEGAQREAVAWRLIRKDRTDWFTWHDMRDNIPSASEIADDWTVEYAYPPPPDRVQPERAKSVPLMDAVVGPNREFDPVRADRELRANGFAPCPTCGNAPPNDADRLNGPPMTDACARAIDELLPREAVTAPPTDASGGVTESCTHCGRNRVVGEGRLPEWPKCCELVCHCTCHNDPLYCHECTECLCHTK